MFKLSGFVAAVQYAMVTRAPGGNEIQSRRNGSSAHNTIMTPAIQYNVMEAQFLAKVLVLYVTFKKPCKNSEF